MFTSSRACQPGGGSTWSSHNRGIFIRGEANHLAAELSTGQDRLLDFASSSGQSKTCVASRFRILFPATGQGHDE